PGDRVARERQPRRPRYLYIGVTSQPQRQARAAHVGETDLVGSVPPLIVGRWDRLARLKKAQLQIIPQRGGGSVPHKNQVRRFLIVAHPDAEKSVDPLLAFIHVVPARRNDVVWMHQRRAGDLGDGIAPANLVSEQTRAFQGPSLQRRTWLRGSD